MKKFVLLALVAAGIMFTACTASAQMYYSGPGYGPHIEPRYDRDYDERRYRRERDRDYYERHYHPAAQCPPNYTVQDGVCKPYRGY